jgi:hypothetical protein
MAQMQDVAVDAAAAAKRLEPWGWFALSVVVLGILTDVVLGPILRGIRNDLSPFEAWRSAQVWVDFLPAFILAYGLWELLDYLGKISRGADWAVTTVRMIREIGLTLVWAGIAAMVVAPTMSQWVQLKITFDFHIDPAWLALAVLGAMLMAIAQTVGKLVQAAAALKAENESFV